MSKYIDVGRQLVRLCRLELDCEEAIKLFLLTADPADVQEVRHGRWEDGRCSACGFDWHDIQYEKTKVSKSPYCPNCGAKMDEVTE